MSAYKLKKLFINFNKTKKIKNKSFKKEIKLIKLKKILYIMFFPVIMKNMFMFFLK